ncbi:MAG: Nramp family divalent metal transporter, partial [Sulfolobales archaeon]
MNGRAVGVRKLRSIRALLGPAVIVSVAYIDPGNFGSNISAGAKFGMSLLWVVWLSGFLAILFQYLSGKLGLARGYSVFEEMMLRIEGLGILSKPLKILYFTSTFIMILATDMAELTGMVVGIALLLNIPLEIALPIAFLDIIILFIALERVGRLHEIIAVLVGVVGFSLLYELHIVGVDFTEVIRSSITISSLSGEISIYATAIIGATIMPHALLLHSYLSRDEWRTQEDPSRALRKHLKDTLLYLSIASLLNAALQVLSYYAFYIHGM